MQLSELPPVSQQPVRYLTPALLRLQSFYSHRRISSQVSGTPRRVHSFPLTAPPFDSRAWIRLRTTPLWIKLSSRFIYEPPDTCRTQELHSSAQAWAPCWCMHAGDKTPGKKEKRFLTIHSFNSYKKWMFLVGIQPGFGCLRKGTLSPHNWIQCIFWFSKMHKNDI